jgi:hypothetical protein
MDVDAHCRKIASRGKLLIVLLISEDDAAPGV